MLLRLQNKKSLHRFNFVMKDYCRDNWNLGDLKETPYSHYPNIPLLPRLCWPRTNRLSAISPAKMGIFGTRRELQFWDLQLWRATCKSPHGKRRRTLSWRKRQLGGLQSTESVAFHRLSPCQERRAALLPPAGLCYPQCVRAPPSRRSPHSI